MKWKPPSLSLSRFAGEGTLTISMVDEGLNLLALPRKRRRAGVGVVMVTAMALISSAHAVTPGEMLPDPAMEARARAITSELRCLVCQNQSVDDSDAALAKDLRVLVREKLKDGMSDAEVKDYVHSRYGDFVLLRPPLKLDTILLWTAPFLALLAGASAVWSASRRRRAAPVESTELTAQERARLAALGLPERQPRDSAE